MCTYNPIDWNKGVKSHQGNDEQFKEFLIYFEEHSFYRIMNELYQSMLEFDLGNIGVQAAALKKVFSMVSAEEPKKIAEELEQAAMDGDGQNTLECYVLLLDEAKAIQEQLSKISQKTYQRTNFEKQEKAVRKKHSDILPLDKPIQRRRPVYCVANCNIF